MNEKRACVEGLILVSEIFKIRRFVLTDFEAEMFIKLAANDFNFYLTAKKNGVSRDRLYTIFKKVQKHYSKIRAID